MDAAAYEKVMLKLRNHEDQPVLDGAVDESLYQLAPWQILWVLREHHKGDEAEARKGWDYREFVKATAEAARRPAEKLTYSRWKRTLGPIAIVSHGLLHGLLPYGNWASDWNNLAHSLCRIAIININKDGGDTRVNWPRLLAGAAKYAEITAEQIRCLAPNIVICGGTYERTVKYAFPQSYARPLPKNIEDAGRLVIDASHPNQRKLTWQAYYETIREQVQRWQEKLIN